ncbi:glucosamine-6-phosphate deaminase [Bradyrhizobium sp. 521_C7_N1_3]|uniref:glucosamine-6-phosphate deaminase n=1 Tax=Bradyrhizobium TaxID=374 RepID=UPI0027146DF9|nr:glucosamine-6-phosphate deaminase [Bradyrhizobium japonicum]WLB56611.1 glucosamine-6-phosphate deaminase [Bradyrhizobium japonicum]WLB61496.1 glucosamine-6-phosphate deaminase [Bradyrhizobium japonicum]
MSMTASVTPSIATFETRDAMGRAAAADVAAALRDQLGRQSNVRMIFAAAPSQTEMLDALARERDIDWRRVTAFHMDEYLGLPADAPERFGAWLTRHLFSRIAFGAVHLIGQEPDPERVAARYAALLGEAPIDIICLGIGVNGHLAFNDPPVADLHDTKSVKIVELDAVCRQQQVDDECFPTLGDVPTHAITLTIPRLLDADRLFCVVPGASKRAAVERSLYGPIGAECPASALRTHPRCALYLDQDSTPPQLSLTPVRA